ncbi:hypothetical protein SADUNF_Sadunf15G0012500 [Salix dunnii]|uniref:Bifunctional inhibitor/plant lipid transfer protein/seed storage helical domain-containing protein n=1 Tax=Salix dunnii TaxID=1413687 RepID=A0A835JEK2_9ROSI|nr:hypothetical protein SADUNF_Sadunf15G0012500 [Salix dunnii]
MRESKGLETDLKRRRVLTGSLARISMTMSSLKEAQMLAAMVLELEPAGTIAGIGLGFLYVDEWFLGKSDRHTSLPACNLQYLLQGAEPLMRRGRFTQRGGNVAASAGAINDRVKAKMRRKRMSPYLKQLEIHRSREVCNLKEERLAGIRLEAKTPKQRELSSRKNISITCIYNKMSSAIKSAISLLLLAMVVTKNGATVLPVLDPGCPLLTGNLDACLNAENFVAITVTTSPQCCQGLQSIVAANATINLSQAASCQCFTNFLAARIPIIPDPLRITALASLQTRCNVSIGVNATTCVA